MTVLSKYFERKLASNKVLISLKTLKPVTKISIEEGIDTNTSVLKKKSQISNWVVNFLSDIDNTFYFELHFVVNLKVS